MSRKIEKVICKSKFQLGVEFNLINIRMEIKLPNTELL